MKKIVLFLIMILSLITIYTNFKTTDNSKFIVKNKNYEIKEIKDDSNIKYNYIIYDDNHNEMDKGITYRINPSITNTYGILQLCINEGTGLTNCRYYDTKEKKKSKWFETPILSNNKIVVKLNKLPNPTAIIIENIFDKSNSYKKYDINFSNKELWPLNDIKFVSDNQIEITYISDSEKIETKIILLDF